MSGLVKVGYSMRDPEMRARELDNTGSPHKYIDAVKAVPSLPPNQQALTPLELEELKELELRLRKLHAEVHTELKKINEQVFKLMSKRIQDSRLFLPLYSLIKLELRQAVVHDFHRISDYAMPLNWLKETLPAFSIK